MSSANAIGSRGAPPAPASAARLPFLPWPVAILGMLLVYYGTELATEHARVAQWLSLTSLIDLMRPGLLGAFALYALVRLVARPGKLLGPWQATAAWAVVVAIATALLTRLPVQRAAAPSAAASQALGWALEVMALAARDVGLTLALVLLALSAAQLVWSSLAAGRRSQPAASPAQGRRDPSVDDASPAVERERSATTPAKLSADVRAALASNSRALRVCIAAMERAGYLPHDSGDATPPGVVTFASAASLLALDLRCWSDEPTARSIEDAAAVKSAQPLLGWVVVLAASAASIGDEMREAAEPRGVLLAERSAVMTWLERSAQLSLDPAGALAQLLSSAGASRHTPQTWNQRSRSFSAMSFSSSSTSSARGSRGSR